jgi:hypothetical protein
MTAAWVGYQFREVTELALNLHPDRRRIVVIDARRFRISTRCRTRGSSRL